MQMLCMRSRIQPNTGSQRIPRTVQQLKSEQKAVATRCVSIWELPTRLSTRYQVHKQRSTCCCPTHEMWELHTPLTVANRSQQGDEDGMLTDYRREMSSHTSLASRKRSKAISKRSVLVRGVQHYHSYFNRRCLPSAIEEYKVEKDFKLVHQLGKVEEKFKRRIEYSLSEVVEAQNCSSADQVQCTRAVIECEAEYKCSDRVQIRSLAMYEELS
ncbi:hypothetical protein F511_44925 [Dorcoceras hygrometricum]|uniref:Uncharacterized protein n=1 Tax=Dorcoceras hygrometricum TaxID=472368 RepID=A0A2Z6ZXT1_9LAMI|nr:hypothetical protein F511_44925 [Dorcoceras hygrometricum]